MISSKKLEEELIDQEATKYAVLDEIRQVKGELEEIQETVSKLADFVAETIEKVEQLKTWLEEE